MNYYLLLTAIKLLLTIGKMIKSKLKEIFWFIEYDLSRNIHCYLTCTNHLR